MKKYVDYWMYGVGIGMVWYLFSLLVWNIAGQSSQQILVTVIVSGFMGLSARIYESDGRPPLYKSIVHFIAILILVVIMTSLNGWIAWTNLSVLGIFLVQFLVIYLVIWTSIYLIEKHKIKRINENLRKTRR
ncbi:DUF3021 domain-containing protein [Streptococcus caprae]|uniref:DUF3021 domain-containing protein n=1 Tax=Streptococcus caprae TaxID=1640501 RepID=A0ABV8CTG9_9STRE